MTKIDLVVARYTEDLGWLRHLSFRPRIFVYNKGPELSADLPMFAGLDVQIVPLPNVGRESHSYLQHIIAHHAEPADVTIFVQGKLDDLGRNVFADLHDYVAPALADGFAASDMEFHFTRLGRDSDIRGKLMADPKYAQVFANGQIGLAAQDFNGFARALLGRLPQVMVVSFQGCFAVSRAAIRQHPPAFYAALQAELAGHGNPEIGHYMERLWCSLFSGTRLRHRALLMTLRRGLDRLAPRGAVRRAPPVLSEAG